MKASAPVTASPRAEQLLEPRQPGLERLHEPGLLLLEQPQHAIAVLRQLGVVPAEDLDGARRDRGEEGAVDAQPLARAPARHRAAQQAAQHVARALVAGQRALGHREGERAHVVGDDARVAQVGGSRGAGAAGLGEHLLHQRGEHVGLEDRALALHDEREPLEAHAGVDARPRQRLRASRRPGRRTAGTPGSRTPCSGRPRRRAPRPRRPRPAGSRAAARRGRSRSRCSGRTRPRPPAGPQKLSLRPSATMRLSGSPTFFHSATASSSRGRLPSPAKTEA